MSISRACYELYSKYVSQNASSTAEVPESVPQLIFDRLKSPNNIMLEDDGNWDK